MQKREGISISESMTIFKLKRLRSIQTVSIANIRSTYKAGISLLHQGTVCYGSYDPRINAVPVLD